MSLQDEAVKLAEYIESLDDFEKKVKGPPVEHVGAIIADAVLQKGHRWETHVKPQVERLRCNFPEAATISGLLRLIDSVGAQELLNWKGQAEHARLLLTASSFRREELRRLTSSLIGWRTKTIGTAS